MIRGEIWTATGAGDYAGKPRPVLLVQDDRFGETDSITVCLFTSDPTDAPLFRPVVAPNAENGLQVPSRLMVDKLVTIRKVRLGRRVGRLGAADLTRLNRAILVFLGLAG